MESFVSEHPNFVLAIVSVLLAILGYFFKRTIDNNTAAMNKISDSIDGIDTRVRQTEIDLVHVNGELLRQSDMCKQHIQICPIVNRRKDA